MLFNTNGDGLISFAGLVFVHHNAIAPSCNTDSAAEEGGGGEAPAAIVSAADTVIGCGGKPSVCFRADGRFVLMEVVIPSKELLQAYRKGGQLRLQFTNTVVATAAGVGADEEMHGADKGHAENAFTDKS